jgi:hypothetical protein
MKNIVTFAVAGAMAFTAGPALAQAQQQQQTTTRQDPFGAIFGALFGDRLGQTNSIEAQWAAGRTPLTDQRAQFDTRVDTEVSTGVITRQTGVRLKSDYASLVELETRYGADRRFTSRERTELADRYGDLTQVLADGAYADGGTAVLAIAEGRAQFDSRVDTAVTDRRVTRSQGRRLKSDYAELVQVEARYAEDGTLSDNEEDYLQSRLDALAVRLGDDGYAGTTPQTPRARLDAIARALPSSGLSSAAQAQVRVEAEDISRLEVAYARLSASSDDMAYLDRRLTDLETRTQVRRY